MSIAHLRWRVSRCEPAWRCSANTCNSRRARASPSPRRARSRFPWARIERRARCRSLSCAPRDTRTRSWAILRPPSAGTPSAGWIPASRGDPARPVSPSTPPWCSVARIAAASVPSESVFIKTDREMRTAIYIIYCSSNIHRTLRHLLLYNRKHEGKKQDVRSCFRIAMHYVTYVI